MPGRLLFIALCLCCCRRQAVEPVHFAREEVRLDVRPGTLEVSATYHFTCKSKQPVGAVMSYPFPLDSLNPYPDSVVIAGYSFERSDSAVRFTMHFRPGREDSFRAWYRQPLKGRSARYIVTSTRKWNRPIDVARFQVTVPASLGDVRLSYEADSVTRSGSATSYFFTRKGFFPDRDVIVEW
jgi:hypothetical protein